ncbi:MAG: response regulator transcription factor [bacterium]|nr:response regulator transcription factor [bacterium]
MGTQFQECIVYVVDDDEAVLRSIEWLLQSVPFNVKTYSSANAFLSGIGIHHQGCLVTDLRMPEMNGIELHAVLQKRKIDLPVIVMTAHGQIALAVDAMKQGVFDFIEKPFDDQHFIDSINKAIRHGLERAEEREQTSQLDQQYSTLTEREEQVCKLVIEGSTNKEISAKLNISEKTVEAHRAQGMRKMGATSLAELIRMLLMVKP